MHLLKPRSTAKVNLDDQIRAIPQFPITISKRDIVHLMETLEEDNARAIQDVNNGE